ncbi:MAG: hypothetical protein ABGX22_08185 [Pirellulaceae bacterium]|jgi:hypothetical protein|nr:hypothetical protein [Planctomycetaceae bacterium]
MSTMVDETAVSPSTSPSQRLRTSFAAVRIAFTWLGTRKTLTTEQTAQAANTFGAEGQFLSAGKKLLDTKHPVFKAVTGVRSRIVSFWRGISLPFPEPGVRLIRQDQIDVVAEQLTGLKEELDEAVWRLDERYAELKSVARDRLGSLFNPADYPDSLQGMFHVTWDFPSVEPPDYLRQLNPEVYRQECERVTSRFDEAVQLAEAAFVEELQSLVSHLTERLSGQADGKPKVFRDSAVDNLTQFFERFRDLNIRSNEQLDDLVSQCQQVVSGVEPQSLRDNQVLRMSVAGKLSQVQSVLDDLLVDRPRRNILRRPR